MSTIVISNIKATGETASRSVSGVAAAWVKYDASGTVVINDSNNIASITDNGSGDYSLNFSNNMASGDYSMAGSLGHTSSSVTPTSCRPNAAFTSSVCRYNQLYTNNGGLTGLGDYSQSSNIIHGDLA